MADSDLRTGGVYQAGELFIVFDRQSHVHGVDARTGAILWSSSLGRNTDYEGLAEGTGIMVFRGYLLSGDEIREMAARYHVPSAVMTFEPQPLEYFSGIRNAPPRISTLRDKLTMMQELGIDRLISVRFNREFSSMSPESFIRDILVGKLGVRCVVVGDDFCFGRGRSGNLALLREMGKEYGFEAIGTESFMDRSQRVSSTLIRKALTEGDLAAAGRILGREYSISGKVTHGDEIGRTIGFPTANIHLGHRRVPVAGVFAVRVLLDGKSWGGMANIGTRPTVAGQEPRLEVNIFGRPGDIYGRRITVMLLKKLRDEIKFPSLESLRRQIEADAVAAMAAAAEAGVAVNGN